MRMLTVLSAVLLVPALAGAQTADARWNGWLGCWDLVLESARDMASPPDRRGTESTTPSSTSRPQVCVQPATGGATFSTRVGARTPIEQTVIADGMDHPLVDGDCRGTQRTEWSRDGRRLFSSADLTCSNDSGRRRVSGLAILGSNGTWTDIQAVDISGQETVRVRRYRRVSDPAQAVRGRTGTRLTIDDVKEAGPKVAPTALEAALVETGSTFALSGKELIALQDAGVPSRVTDLMIALSYPDRFVVERTVRTDRSPVTLVDDPFFLGWAFGYPMWSDLYGFYSPMYGSYSSYFYSPFSYGYLRGYDPRYSGGTVIVIGDGDGSAAPGRPSGTGRVVDGLGYTRVRAREAETASNTPSTSGSSASSSSGSSSSSSSSSGGGGSVSTQGFSSGGSGGDGGRTAQPR